MIVCANTAHYTMPGSHGVTHHHRTVAQVRDCFLGDEKVNSIEEDREIDDLLAEMEVQNGIEDRLYYEADCS